MLTTVTIIIILLILFSFNCTIKTMLEVQEHQYNINKDLKKNIEILDKRTAQIIDIIGKHVKEETEIYELISNFSKEE
jgi:thioredoxin-related protein